MHDRIKLFAGGGCLWNPGKGAIGFIVCDKDGYELDRRYWCIGHSTNNRATYESLIEGLEFIRRYTPGYVNCFLENKLVVNQAKGWWSVNNNELKWLLNRVNNNESYFVRVYYTLVKSTHPMILEVETGTQWDLCNSSALFRHGSRNCEIIKSRFKLHLKE
ncbi:MAG: reverse transcriptase-like protein, partial [Candidatus Aminicenantes bacterium]|nr:reverse transcriptase-like protein [Candidatus Aminicenantes bacterium]